jgi:hypothetical protein
MGQPLELYRGVEISLFKVALHQSEMSQDAKERHVARIGEWLIVGTLDSVREQVDRILGNKRGSNPGS